MPKQATGADGSNNARLVSVRKELFNGTTWDRDRNNEEVTALASAVRAATTNSSDITAYNAKAILVILDISSVPGGDTVTVSLTGKDPVSGNYVTLAAGQAQSATGTTAIAIGTGVTTVSGASYSANNVPVPRVFRVTVTHSAGTNFTYSVTVIIDV
jgi:hypothetical protein